VDEFSKTDQKIISKIFLFQKTSSLKNLSKK